MLACLCEVGDSHTQDNVGQQEGEDQFCHKRLKDRAIQRYPKDFRALPWVRWSLSRVIGSLRSKGCHRSAKNARDEQSRENA